MKINRIRNEKGTIFNKRFISKIIDTANMLLEFSKNIHLDSKDLKECYSSYCAYFNDIEGSNLIDSDIILKGIVNDNSVKKYQMYINSEESLENIVCEYDFFECVDKNQCLKNLTQSKKKMNQILKEKNITFEEMINDKKLRNVLINEFRKNSTLSLKEIGEIFGGISASGVCKILSRE